MNSNDPLSPPARRISDAFWRSCLGKEATFQNDREALAAGLRAAADEIEDRRASDLLNSIALEFELF